MSSMRAPGKIKFIKKLGQAPEMISIEDFEKQYGFTWRNSTQFSPEDERKLEKYLHTLKAHVNFSFQACTKKLWRALLEGTTAMVDQVAIYDTESDCGLGLLATETISANEFLSYPGTWSFKAAEQATSVNSGYTIPLIDKKGVIFGQIDAKKHRHYASLIMHGWDQNELADYEFDTQKTRTRIATANAAYAAILRPDGEKGPPFIFTVRTLKVIHKGQALLCNYGNDFMISLENTMAERFFDKNTAAVIDPELYRHPTKLIFSIKFLNQVSAEKFPFDRKLLSSPAVFALQGNNQTFPVPSALLLQLVQKNPFSRFHCFDFNTDLLKLSDAEKQKIEQSVKLAGQPNPYSFHAPAKSNNALTQTIDEKHEKKQEITKKPPAPNQLNTDNSDNNSGPSLR